MSAPQNWRSRLMTLHGALLRGRRAAGLTQQHLADRLGVDRRTVQRWEDGSCDPSSQDLFRWADAVGIDIFSADRTGCDTSAASELTAEPESLAVVRPVIAARRTVRVRDRSHGVPRLSLDGENATDGRSVHGKSTRVLSPKRSGASR